MSIKVGQDSFKLKPEKVSLNWKHFKIDPLVRFEGNIVFTEAHWNIYYIDYVNCTWEIFQYLNVFLLVSCDSEKESFYFWEQNLMASLLLSREFPQTSTFESKIKELSVDSPFIYEDLGSSLIVGLIFVSIAQRFLSIQSVC